METLQKTYSSCLGCLTRASKGLLCVFLLSVLAACSTIDDDLSACPTEPETNYQLDYELRLVTNMTTELRTELTTQTDLVVANALRTYLSDIFTDYAHDVDLSFYDTTGDSVRLQHDQHVMNANQASYTLNLPMRQYMHLASANLLNNPVVNFVSGDTCHRAALWQIDADTISSHTTGLFTARLPMEVVGNEDQQFDVHLYMTNCAASLVVDTIGSGIRDMKVFTTGFASAFSMADSAFIYHARPPIVRASEVETQAEGVMTFCSVNFPSKDIRPTRTIIDTPDPFVSPDAEGSLWEYHIYSYLADGSITETKFYLRKPLRAGQVSVTKAKANPDGSVSTTATVGVSVTTDWNQGNNYNPHL